MTVLSPVEAPSSPATVVFPLLADPAAYRASTFDYVDPAPGGPSRGDWCNVFRKSLPGFRRMALRDEAMPEADREVGI